MLLNLLVLAGAVLAVSKATTDDLFGFALGSLNRYSLARAQVALWTVVVFAALLTVAEWNLLAAHAPDPLNIAIPTPLLSALGISLFSAAAAPAILAVRAAASSPATPEQVDAAAERAAAMAGKPVALAPINQVGANQTPAAASWTDLFTGDDVSITGRLDLSKLQQALLTVIVVGIYLATVLGGFGTAAKLDSLPDLGADAVRLLAISHAGYLAFKAVPKP